MAPKNYRRLWMIEKPFWNCKRALVRLWHWPGLIWHAVMRFLNRDIVSFIIICVYAVGAAVAIFIWPPTYTGLRIFRPIDVALLAIFFLWLLMLLAWMHEKVQEQMLRWVPALLASPFWFPLFIPLVIGLVAMSLVLFGLSILFTPLGGLAMVLGLLFAWWRARHGITLRCKHGECYSGRRSFRDIEVHYLCPGNCGRSYGFLIPSHHGILSHACTCGGKIPALKYLRLRRRQDGTTLEDTLKKECPAGHPWSAATDPLPAHFIAVAGGTSAGKTCYLTMLLKDLLSPAVGSYQGVLEDKRDTVELDNNLKKMNSGVRLPETRPGDPPLAFITRLTSQNGKLSRLYLYDAAGERYSSMKVEDFVFFEDLSGIILLVDPFNLPKLSDQMQSDYPDVWKELKVSTLPLEYVVAGVCKNVSRWLKLGAGGRSEVPLAVVINKADAPLVNRVVGAAAKQTSLGKKIAEHDLCRQALIDWGAAKEIQVLEDNFNRIQYFSCSVLGRTPDKSNRPFQAEQVLPPLIWLLTAKSGKS